MLQKSITDMRVCPRFSQNSIVSSEFVMNGQPVLLLAACADGQVRQAARDVPNKCSFRHASAGWHPGTACFLWISGCAGMTVDVALRLVQGFPGSLLRAGTGAGRA